MHRKHLSSHQKKAIILRGIDIEKVKKGIMKEVYYSYGNKQYSKTEKKNNSNIIEKYETEYHNYLNNTFNSKCVSMMIFFIKETKNLPNELRVLENFSNKIISIIKKLMMNEFEISLFTLNIDFYGWIDENKIYNPELYLLFLGLYSKQLTNDKCNIFFMKFNSENDNFVEYYQKWESKLNKRVFNLKEIGNRFRFLNQSHNSFCQVNFIDFDSVVDKIIRLSHPYGEENKGSNLKVHIKEENLIDNVNNKTNETNNEFISLLNNNNSNNYLIKGNSSFIFNRESEKSLIHLFCELGESYISKKEFSLDNSNLLNQQSNN